MQDRISTITEDKLVWGRSCGKVSTSSGEFYPRKQRELPGTSSFFFQGHLQISLANPKLSLEKVNLTFEKGDRMHRKPMASKFKKM